MNTATIKRPVLRYHGGKWRLAPWVIRHMPPHEVYVEPFGGAASVLLQKQPTRIEVYNDIDESLVSLFRILRDPVKSEELRRLVTLTPFSRSEFALCWKPCSDELESARRLVTRMFQAIGAKGSLEKNGWRTRTSKAVWSPCVSWSGWPDEIPKYVARLREVIIECLPWQKLLEVYDAPNALIYADPPYPLASRSTDHRRIYVHEMFDADHEELLRRLCIVEGMVLLSSYPNELYDSVLPREGWQQVNCSARAQTNARRTEVLWLNPSVLSRLQPTLLMEDAA